MYKLWLVLLAVVLVGCASLGNDFQFEDADRIKNGMTRDEVISTMGGQRPWSVGADSFTYLYSRANWVMASQSMRRFTVVFDESGKVKNAPEKGYFNEISKHLGERPI